MKITVEIRDADAANITALERACQALREMPPGWLPKQPDSRRAPHQRSS